MNSFLHGGDRGDLIYALSSIKAAGAGHLFLTQHSQSREMMSHETISFLRPLLEYQSYITGVNGWNNETITHNFLDFRNSEKIQNLAEWQARFVNVQIDLSKPWLIAPKSIVGRPVFNRTLRYQNPLWDRIWAILVRKYPNALFVGLEDEYKEFCKFGKIKHKIVKDSLELASIIASAPFFAGNQSFPLSIATALNIIVLQETYPTSPDCLFNRPNFHPITQYNDLTPEILYSLLPQSISVHTDTNKHYNFSPSNKINSVLNPK